MSSESPTYGSTELAKILGLSLRQLQWMDERSILQPSATPRSPRSPRSWIARRYSKMDTLMLAVIAELRTKGVPLQQIRGALPLIRRRFSTGIPPYVVFIPHRKSLFADTCAELVNLLTRLTVAAYAIDTRELRKKF